MSSRTAAAKIGIGVPHLRSLVRDARIPPPPKNEFGYYEWRDSDLERARQALAVDRRRRPAVASAS
jgi:hypothetical protein